jgi:hypothetical protein
MLSICHKLFSWWAGGRPCQILRAFGLVVIGRRYFLFVGFCWRPAAAAAVYRDLEESFPM